jgi:hypothetical protein
MPSTKGVSGSSTGQACRTNSYRLRRALSTLREKRLSTGLLEDSVKLLELFVSEFAVVIFVLVYLV